MRSGTPPSPVPGVSLQGYPQELSVAAGAEVELMVSGAAGPARLALTRLIHGDPNPNGPGVKQEPVDWGQPDLVAVADQPLDAGSYVEVAPDVAPALTGSFTVTLWLRPTILTGSWQALVARWGVEDLSFGVFAAGQRTITAAVSHDGVTAEWCTGRSWLEVQNWQFVAVTYDHRAGQISVYQSGSVGPAKSYSEGRLEVTTKSLSQSGSVHQAHGPLLMGALPSFDGGGQHWAHFNGKLSRVQLIGESLSHDEILGIRDSTGFPSGGQMLGAWDFSREISGERVVELVADRDGTAVNVPGRGVTGPFWFGTDATMYVDKPWLYDAIQLHDDDVGDPEWSAAARVRAPADAPSGIYAATFERDRDRLVIPFIVTANHREADICYLVPTFTWQAYSSNRGPWSYTEDGLIDTTPCIYDQHRDGSMVYYVSRRRPTRSHNPSAGFPVWGSHNVTADLYLIDWLEHQRFSYNLNTDGDLDREGRALLEPYRCVVIASHPEYWTGAMLDGLRDYLRQGGRCLYLAGNGLYWVTSVDPQRPYVIEVRKSGDWLDWWAHPTPGELAHSTSLEGGGLWSRRGRAPRRMVGVEMAANCFVQPDPANPRGYHRLPASYEPDCEFVFDGVGDGPIGGYGLNLGSAASYEMDGALELDGSEDLERVILAEATDDSFIPLDRSPVRPRSSLALTTLPGGGAVFAAGSVSWTGSLSHQNYSNDVSRITANVLRRFIDTPRGASVLGPRLRP